MSTANKHAHTKKIKVKFLAEGETCAPDTVVHSCFSVQLFFVLCLENSANCQSDDNRMIFNVMVSILLSLDCVNKI